MANDKKTGCINSKRLFIGIILPADLRVQLFESISLIARQDLAIRPIAPECIHLTLKFLGGTEILMIPEIVAAISDFAGAFKSFSFTAEDKIGVFPDSAASARILFAPVKDPAGNLAAVFEGIETNFAKIKIKKEERKFVPHVTIARVRENLKKDTRDLIKKASLNCNGSIICRKITLFESRLAPAGPNYIILDEFALK